MLQLITIFSIIIYLINLGFRHFPKYLNISIKMVYSIFQIFLHLLYSIFLGIVQVVFQILIYSCLLLMNSISFWIVLAPHTTLMDFFDIRQGYSPRSLIFGASFCRVILYVILQYFAILLFTLWIPLHSSNRISLSQSSEGI